jgi:hypothetical protein
MKQIIRTSIGILVGTVFSLLSTGAWASGFPVGQLLVGNYDTIYLLDPSSGTSNRIVTGMSGLKDVVYNPVSDSAFAAVGSNIIQISAFATGYVSTPFLSGIAALQCIVSWCLEDIELGVIFPKGHAPEGVHRYDAQTSIIYATSSSGLSRCNNVPDLH